MGERSLLDGIRVLDLASVGPAARASRWLADYGADVIKVGPVEQAVQIVPVFHSYGAHRGMRRALFDLKSADGRDAFLALARDADVVIESFRPGVMAKLALAYDDVRLVNERVVYCSTSGYGQTGPRRTWAGHDLNYLAVSGFLATTQPRSDGGPPIPGATIADSAGGGMHTVMAILAALVARATTGSGTYLDVSVADGMVSLMSLNFDEYLASGTVPRPGHNILTGRYACYDLYECSDGGWISVAAIEPHFWRNLCGLLGLEQWSDHQTDDKVQDEVRADLRRVFSMKTRDEWAALLAPADTCVAPVLTVPEAVDDEQFAARGAIVDVTHPTAGAFRQTSALFAGQLPPHAPNEPVRAPDYTQTHTANLLAAAGYPTEKIAALLEHGAIA